ncbi:MAG TPA: hypothetical protein VL490_06930, partial [Mucilaginibacter sp.]|nr:hypothetical protein [Mucilaginibacter sp.]
MHTIIAEIRSAIEAIEKNAKLREEMSFDSRANAIDFMEFHIIDRMDGLPSSADAAALKQRA